MAAGRVRGVAVGEGVNIQRKRSVPPFCGRMRGVAAGEGAVYRGTTVFVFPLHNAWRHSNGRYNEI